MDTIIHNTVHVLLALALPPLLLGVIGKTKALFAGRVGPPLLQPYYDLIKLFRKGSVFSTTTTVGWRSGRSLACRDWSAPGETSVAARSRATPVMRP